MSFFDSDFIKNEIDEIARLQDLIYMNVFKFPLMKKEEKINHVDALKQLLEKQRVLYTRLSLSDDPEAQAMKQKICDSAVMMGLPSGVDINIIFNNMEKLIDQMKKEVERA